MAPLPIPGIDKTIAVMVSIKSKFIDCQISKATPQLWLGNIYYRTTLV